MRIREFLILNTAQGYFIYVEDPADTPLMPFDISRTPAFGWSHDSKKLDEVIQFIKGSLLDNRGRKYACFVDGGAVFTSREYAKEDDGHPVYYGGAINEKHIRGRARIIDYFPEEYHIK